MGAAAIAAIACGALAAVATLADDDPRQPPCRDDPSFVDVGGFPCSAWRRFDCAADTLAYSDVSYTAGDMRDVRRHCRASCGRCCAFPLVGPPGPPRCLGLDRAAHANVSGACDVAVLTVLLGDHGDRLLHPPPAVMERSAADRAPWLRVPMLPVSRAARPRSPPLTPMPPAEAK